MTEFCLRGEPIAKSLNALDACPEFGPDFERVWRAVLPQRMTLVCFKEGSDDIAGMHVSYVITKDDNWGEQMDKAVGFSEPELMMEIERAIFRSRAQS